jgi:hypothetical protein
MVGRQPDNSGYLDLRGLAAYSSIGVSTLREYLKGTNPPPHFRCGGKILVRIREFDQWMEGHRVDSDCLADMVDELVERAAK